MTDIYPKPKSLSRLRVAARCYLNPIRPCFARRPILLCWSIPALWHFSPRGPYVNSYRVAHGRPLERVRGRMKIFGSNIKICLYEAWFEIDRISGLSFSKWWVWRSVTVFCDVTWYVLKSTGNMRQKPRRVTVMHDTLGTNHIASGSAGGEGHYIIIISSSSNGGGGGG